MEVIRAGAQWKEEILRFADRIFGEDVQPGGFAELIPDVYGPEAPCDGNHLLVLEEGKIRALLLTEPTSFVCGGEILRGIGVGTVSVAEDARGKGYMQLLLKTVREWMDKEGYAFAVLAGQRQRYAYWGYEPMETRLVMRLDAGNVRHALTRERTGGLEDALSFAEMEEGSEAEGQAFSLFESLPLHTLRRKETFARHLKSGRCVPLVIRKNGSFAGYLCESVRGGEHRIVELELSDGKLLPAVLRAYWKERASEGFSLCLAPYRTEAYAFLEKICAGCELRNGYQYYLADLRAVLSFCMRARQRLNGLADGEWDFRTEGRMYACSVRKGEVRVDEFSREQAETERWNAAGEWEKSELVRLLFGLRPAVSCPDGVPSGWLPFPLYLPEVDAV